jgi:hypothetical protein
LKNTAVRPTENPEGEMVLELEGEGEGRSEEVAGIKRLADPKKPCVEDIAEHELFHLPYRSWCEVCVKGRGKSLPHMSGKQERGLPEVHFDYMFVGDLDKLGEARACLVCREAATRTTMSTMVPQKGREEYTVNSVVAFLSEVG